MYSQHLYDWIKKPQSRLRMLMTWQSSGGLAYVSGVHLLGMQCFIMYGNSKHEENAGEEVSLEEFQDAIIKRHEMSREGNQYLKEVEYQADFLAQT